MRLLWWLELRQFAPECCDCVRELFEFAEQSALLFPRFGAPPLSPVGALVWVDCVPTHVVLVIGTYPRGAAPGRLLGFRPAPSVPSGAEVLRARTAVLAVRAYGLTVHLVLLPIVKWRSTGAVPPALRLMALLFTSGRTVPRGLCGGDLPP